MSRESNANDRHAELDKQQQPAADLMQCLEDLRLSEARFRTMIDSMPFEVFTLDKQRRFTSQNAASKKQWGDYTGKDAEALVSEKVMPAVWPSKHRQAYRGHVVRAEEIVPVEGKNRCYYRILAPIKEDGDTTGVVGVSIDITRRKELEQHLRFLCRITDRMHRIDQPNKLLHMVIRAISKHLQVPRCFLAEIDHEHDRAVIHQDVHHTFSSLAGTHTLSALRFIPTGDLQAGRRVVSADAAHDPRFAANDRAQYRSHGMGALVAVPLMEEGNWKGMLWVSMAEPRQWSRDELELLDTIGKCVWFAFEKARCTADLRENEERFRVALLNTPVTVFNQDCNLRYTWAYNATPGYPVDRLLGRQDREILTCAEDSRALETLKRQVLATNRPARQEVRIRTADHQERYFDLTLEPLHDKAENVVGLTGAALDITGCKQLAEELRRARDKLEARVRERTAALKESEQRFRHLSSQLLHAQENERKRVANEIHDSAGQVLAAIKYRVESAYLKLQKAGAGEALQPVQDLIPVVKACIDDMRRLQMELRPTVLDDMGVVAAIEWFCREFQQTYPSITVEQTRGVNEEELPGSLKLVIFRIVQEALTNTGKHSDASFVRILLEEKEGTLRLRITDNGRGFDLKEAQKITVFGKGLGLSSMRERAEYSGGMLSIESSRGQGTRIEAAWPKAMVNGETV